MKRDRMLTAKDLERGERRVGAEECPFSWTQQKEGCVFTMQVWKPVRCRGSACKLWSDGDCVFNAIAGSLSRLQSALGGRVATE